MDPTNEEILRLLKELIDSTERRLAARYDRMIETIDSCLTTGGTAPSSSISAGSDVYGVADVPTPASLNPIAEVPTPASSDSDANLITIDVDVPAAPTRTTRLMGDPSPDSGSAPAPLTAPTVHTATADIVPVLAAPAATDRALDGQAISGVPAMPASCSIVCLPRHPVAAPVVVASSTPATPECVLDTNSTLVEVVPLPTTGEFPAVLTSTAFTFMFQMEQLYSGRKIFMPTYCQLIASKVPRPMPWPSLMGVHVDGVEARPLPWPSFRKINSCEFPSGVVAKASHAGSCASIESQISDFCGNLFTSAGCIITCDLCNFGEWRCSDDVLLIHWGSASNSVQSAHKNDTPIVCRTCTISGFHLLVMVRRLELKLLSIGPTSVTLLTFLLDSGNFASHWLLPCVHGPAISSSNSVVCDEWVLPPWDSGQQAAASYDQLSCANCYAPCWPGYIFTGVLTQGVIKVSVLKLCWSSAPPSFLMENFSAEGIGSPESSGSFVMPSTVETTLFCIDTEGYDMCMLSNKLLQHDKVPWPHSLSLFEYNQEGALSYMDLSYFHIQAGLHFFCMGTSRALMQSISRGNKWSYSFPTIVLCYMGFQPLNAPIHAVCTCTPSSIWDASYSKKFKSCILARELWFPPEGIQSWIHSDNRPYAGHALLIHGFVFMRMLIDWPSSVPAKFSTNEMSSEDNESNCLLYWYNGGPALFLLLAFDGQDVFQGRRFRYRILVNLAVATHLAVRSNCLTDRQLDMGTKTTWYSDSKYSMMVVNNSATSVHIKKLQVAYISAQMEWDNIASVLSRGLIHLGSPDLMFACSMMGRLSLFILIQSVALKNMEPSWSTTALLTEFASMFSTGFSVQTGVDCSVQSILSFTHAYQLSIVAPTMFSSAWDNLDCISHSRTARFVFQVTSTELLLFIGAFGGGQEPIQGGRHMTGLDLHVVLRFPWDPGVAAAAWGQAALWVLSLAFERQAIFQGERGVVISIIRDRAHDCCIDNFDSLYSNGLKILQVPWDPGGSELIGSSATRLGDKPYFKEGGVSRTLPI